MPGGRKRSTPGSRSFTRRSSPRSWAGACGAGSTGLHRSPRFPELRKQPEAQRLGQVGHAGRAARARLIADDALDGLHVLKAPELEAVIQIDEALGQFV